MPLSATQLEKTLSILWWGSDDGLRQIFESNLGPLYTFQTSLPPGQGYAGIAHIEEAHTLIPQLPSQLPWLFLIQPGACYTLTHPLETVIERVMPVRLFEMAQLLETISTRSDVCRGETWVLNASQRLLKNDHGAVHLTEQECKIFQSLHEESGPPALSTLRQHVWDYAPHTTLETIDTALTQLQRKIASLKIKLPRPKRDIRCD